MNSTEQNSDAATITVSNADAPAATSPWPFTGTGNSATPQSATLEPTLGNPFVDQTMLPLNHVVTWLHETEPTQPLDERAAALVTIFPGAFERLLVAGAIQRRGFYNSIKRYVCAKDPRAPRFDRWDFITPRFNHLFGAVAKFWEITQESRSEASADCRTLKGFVADIIAKSPVDDSAAAEIDRDIDRAFETRIPEDILRSITGSPLRAWLGRRLALRLCEALHNWVRADDRNIAETQKFIDEFWVNNPLPGDGSASARPLAELQSVTEDDPDELLKHRFLCRGGSLLLVSHTGLGKSSFIMQCGLQWALGRPAFGIKPRKSLRLLIIQAENDDGDMAEMRDGVCSGLKLSDSDARAAASNIMVVHSNSHAGASFFSDVLEPLLSQNRPDIVVIDPLLAYLGGDANDQSVASDFLRNKLNPLLDRHHCGCIIVHHANKGTSGRKSAHADPAYLATGSSELPNWSRCILTITRVRQTETFRLTAAKRGKRLGWRSEATEAPTLEKFIAHAETGIFWRDVEESVGTQSNTADGTAASGGAELERFLSIFPSYQADENIEPESALLTRPQQEAKMRELGLPRGRRDELLTATLNSGAIRVVTGLPRNRKLWGRPEAVEAYYARQKGNDGQGNSSRPGERV